MTNKSDFHDIGPDLEPHADVEEDHDGHGDDEEEQRRRLEEERRRVQDPAVRGLGQRLQRRKRREV